MKSYSPVGISVYDREEHFRSCIAKLQKNELAPVSDIFIFSDAPKTSKDETKIKSIRKFASSIDGFKSVTVVERSSNSRVFNNRDGQRKLLESYDRLIWLEDDIETAPGFLTFMNHALDGYANTREVFSVTGYCPPLRSKGGKPKEDIMFLNRFNAWGFGIWKDRYNLIRELKISDLRLLERQFLDELGHDVLSKVLREVRGSLNALDVRAMFWQTVHGMYTAYPTQSLTRNCGFDGSGLHSAVSSKFDIIELCTKLDEFKLNTDIVLDRNILEQHKQFRKIGSLARIKSHLSWIYYRNLVPILRKYR